MANIKNGGVVKKDLGDKKEVLTKNTVSLVMNELLDSSGIKARINELLGRRSAQFTGSLVSMINADKKMQQAFKENPMSIIQSGLRAATYDLPIDPGLGYAYIIPFNTKVDGSYKMTANFIMGYKGMYQLAVRTGVYSKINVVDVRKGELKSYNRLTEDIELEFVDDEDKRQTLPVVGYCGFFRLDNGMEKIIYKSIKELDAHEKCFRKGDSKGKGWNMDPDSMYRKTILRMLIGKWGIMSIDYQKADNRQIELAEAVAKGLPDDLDDRTIDVETGEVIPPEKHLENPEFSDADMEAALAGMDK